MAYIKNFLKALGVNPNSETLEKEFETRLINLGVDLNKVDLTVF